MVIPAALTVVEEAGGALIALATAAGIAAAGLGAFALAASSQLAQVKAALENSFQAWQSSLQQYVTPVLQEITSHGVHRAERHHPAGEGREHRHLRSLRLHPVGAAVERPAAVRVLDG